jgi:uncharacterized protein YndB with AHSA1/START domain
VSDPRDVDVVVQTTASREAVWALLADARGWSRWAPFRTSVLEREGSPVPDGVGALRRFGTGLVVSREEVVDFDPPGRLVYELRSGLPLRDYRAEVTLTPAGAGTEIAWRARFRPRIPGTGWIFRLFLRRVIGDMATRLARHAEGQEAARPVTSAQAGSPPPEERPSRCRAVATVNDSLTSYCSTRQVAEEASSSLIVVARQLGELSDMVKDALPLREGGRQLALRGRQQVVPELLEDRSAGLVWKCRAMKRTVQSKSQPAADQRVSCERAIVPDITLPPGRHAARDP